jgi:hypothetical protein
MLYPISELEAWDQKNMLTCHASKRLAVNVHEEV